jgi:uncharacterized protein YjbJ (UPF0337 family)
MSKLWVQGRWNEVKGKAKERWGKLTDADLARIDGKREQLVGIVQHRYTRTKDEAEEELRQWEARHGMFQT